MLTFFWQRFLILGWIGRVVAVILTLYGTGWVLGTLGAHGPARQLGAVALYVLAVLLTWLFIRQLWRMSKKPGR